ncbi:MAG TPA: GIY-YIG nuclease family protein [Acidimicrobiales bacterium]|nr:GIY-YIG nuclease family protein [Acidimicrobiales bacterium]
MGTNRPTVRVCDFRSQRGIYVLYDDYGPYYVGLVRDQDIGNRLRSHTRDVHQGRWDRFSWFGFRRVLEGCEPDGIRKLGKVPERLLTQSRSTIGDIEALMIQSLGTQMRGNVQQMRFAAAEQWTQVMRDEVGDYLDKVGS